MRVVGVDPAPRLGAHVFDDGACNRKLCTPKLVKEMEDYQSERAVLVCWDAPLTGPADAEHATGAPGEFTKRPIERFFTRKEWEEWRTPSGISVQGYAGCQHWAISRHVLGLPRVGHWDAHESELPFELLTEGRAPSNGHYVVEVHPALALWLWCKDDEGSRAWKYKKDRGVREALWDRVCAQIRESALDLHEIMRGKHPPKDHDELDSRIAWVLGKLWIQGTGQVEILGDGKLGSFLLPVSAKLRADFQRFRLATRA